ncbi:MAG: SpoIID/LytB domain-containing protein [Oscillospiraceae bacterium]|nr:SpoIID/LytB domain-containing protein [Oscillospiraceae bacterium]
MKEYIVIIAVFAVLLFATPFVFRAVNARETPQTSDSGGQEAQPHFPDGYDFPKTVSLLRADSGAVVELSVRDYLIGCLFAQIPSDYHEQALKAQAVAAHTYMLRLRQDREYVSDEPETCQPYFDEEQARALFRSDAEYDNALTRITAAADYGAVHALFHGGEPIYAVYHSISAGVTNTAYTVWGVDFPYLRSVDSSWDREHSGFIQRNEVSADSLRLAMFHFNRTATMPQDYDDWFSDPYKNEFGYVISIAVGEEGKRLTGGDMWRAFELRSTSFDISRRMMGSDDDVFVIETRGFGHGVGLSQYGADVLGRRGYGCEEILRHYYTDVVLAEVRT